MEQATGMPSQAAIEAKNRLTGSFRRRGIITAVMSGITYGNYTAFMTLAMSVGIWSRFTARIPALLRLRWHSC